MKGLDGKPVAAIVGRSFSTAESYRKMTEKASSGDWAELPVDQLFESIHLTDGRDSLEKALEKLEKASADIELVPAERGLCEAVGTSESAEGTAIPERCV